VKKTNISRKTLQTKK